MSYEHWVSLKKLEETRNELFNKEREKMMLKLSLLIITVFFLWCFTIIYTLKGANISENSIEIKKSIQPFVFKLESNSNITVEELEIKLIEEYKEIIKSKAFKLSNDYINKQRGDCYYIAMKFIKELKGLTNTKKIKIKESEALPGDLIYYSYNGYGQTHWAVYLDTDISLHGSGNWNGDTILNNIHLKKMSKPIFYRVEEDN